MRKESSSRHTFRIVALALGLAGGLGSAASRLDAQEESTVEQLAPVLSAEDARDYQPALFSRSVVAPDSLVRRIAALAAGRIGDVRATPELVKLLSDPDSTVRPAAAFALGLLRDTAASQPLIDRLTGLPALDVPTAVEAMTALAKIGGRRAGDFFGGVLSGRLVLSQDDPTAVVNQAIGEAWRLGADAPVTDLLPFMEDSATIRRSRAVFSLGRLRAAPAANRMLLALRDQDAYTRSLAARALSRGYAEAAGLALPSVAELLFRAADDASPPVRINAIRSLASYRGTALAAKLVPMLADPFPSVQVQVVETLGELGGPDAAKGLAKTATGKGTYAVRRAALVALGGADSAAFEQAAASWRTSADWRDRAAAAEGSAAARPGSAPAFLSDRDGRVVAAGLQAWAAAVEGPDPALLAAARRLLGHPDAAVRSVAADAVARAADPADLPTLVRMYGATGRDSFPEAALSALGAILAIRKVDAAARARVDREFLGTSTKPANYLLRRWAEESWPEAAARWGPAHPIATGRSLQDYRDVARRYLTTTDSTARPHIIIETEGRGPVEIELLGPDAPLTVDNFLRLVDRRFLDRNRWHRVVPNFVVQDGDRRGDGWGSSGIPIRDEINRVRYDSPVLGMALSGPDTGSSQWFITLSPQPHLDGGYTVFGRVVGSFASLGRITQGDVIRTIRR